MQKENKREEKKSLLPIGPLFILFFVSFSFFLPKLCCKNIFFGFSIHFTFILFFQFQYSSLLVITHSVWMT